MAKGKNLNPADALRKAQRKKELKKNKEQRHRTREFALVKKDTAELEDEIAELQGIVEPTKAQSSRLSELKTELDKIMKKKDEYVAEHPEQRNLVYRRWRGKEKEAEDDEERTKAAPRGKAKRNLFNKHGLPRHPERSVYYDPVMNPYGMPPPGMPYAERALLPGEVNSEAEESGSNASDDDIPMPEGPPPGATSDDDGESDDDVPLPEGPPPGAATMGEGPSDPPLPPGSPPLPFDYPPFMLPFPPNFPPQMVPGTSAPPLPVTPKSAQVMPPRPPGFTYPPISIPSPPPGFFPRRGQRQAAGAMQDPLSGVPHQTFQAHHAARYEVASNPSSNPSTLPINPNLPAKPGGAVPGSTPPPKADIDSATVSAEPQLRDLKKESTAFVPAALKRKKAGGASGGRVNAAPSVNAGDTGAVDGMGSEGVRAAPKPDLLGSLREKFGSKANGGAKVLEDDGETKTKRQKIEKPKDDYDKFLDEMGDMLGA